ncbi:MAG: hypothetical protein ACP5PA_04660 [Elusimicrobiales bacterium]
MISDLKQAIYNWLSRWYRRFKAFVYLFAIWAVIYSTVSICGFSIAFEYDDGLVYSADSFLKARDFNGDEFWAILNSNAELDRTKIIPGLIYYAARFFGFSTDIIADRRDINSSNLIKRWHASQIYFIMDSNQKYELLNTKRYLIFFASSDDGIIQAKKAGIKTLRIKRNPKSLLSLPSNPGKFSEPVIPLSQF